MALFKGIIDRSVSGVMRREDVIKRERDLIEPEYGSERILERDTHRGAVYTVKLVPSGFLTGSVSFAGKDAEWHENTAGRLGLGSGAGESIWFSSFKMEKNENLKYGLDVKYVSDICKKLIDMIVSEHRL